MRRPSPGGENKKREEKKQEKGKKKERKGKRDEFFIKKATSVNARLKLKEKTEGGGGIFRNREP